MVSARARPKRRKPILIGEVKERLEQIIYEVAKEKGMNVLSLAVNSDHVYFFVSANPMISAHKTIKAFKGRTSRVLKK